MKTDSGSAVVADLNAARAASMAERAMTIAEAADWGQWCRRTPDGALSPTTARKVIDTLLAALERNPCYIKAMLAGQDVFVLRQHDRAAPAAIQAWAAAADGHGCPDAKVNEAYRKAARWLAQPDADTKWPD